MRCIIQRVLSGSVTVDGRTIGAIDRGLVVLVGIRRSDTVHDAAWLANKLLNLRLFDDTTGKPWSASVAQKNYQLLLVSQFTLYAQLKGNKPDFHDAMAPDQSISLWNQFVELVKKSYHSSLIQCGEFGADMKVAILNDGPVTITLSTDEMDFSKEIKKAEKQEKYGANKKQSETKNQNNNTNSSTSTSTNGENNDSKKEKDTDTDTEEKKE